MTLNHRQRETLDELMDDFDDVRHAFSITMAITGEIIAIDWNLRMAYEIASDGRYDELVLRPQ